MMAAPLQNVIANSASGLATDFETLLKKLGLLEADPQVLDEAKVMKAVATNLSKYWAALSGAAGGGLSLASIVAAWKASEEPTKLALIGGGSLTLAATVIAIALIVRSDLAARARVTGALYRARMDITRAVIAAPRDDANSTPATVSGSGDASTTSSA